MRLTRPSRRGEVVDLEMAWGASSGDIAASDPASDLRPRQLTARRRSDPLPQNGQSPASSAGDQAADDAELMGRLCLGDTAAFAALYDRYAAQVHGLTLAVLHDDRLAEDATHDVFLGLWRRPQAFDPQEGAFAAWFLRVARNRAIDLLRHRREQPFAIGASEDPPPSVARWSADPDPDPAEQAIALLVGREVRAALARLTPDQRRLLELAYFGGLTQCEIAAQLERPLGTVKSQIRTAMRRLAELLDVWSPARADGTGAGTR